MQIWRDGKQLNLGRLFLWEGCAACQTMPRADVSVGVYVRATGDKLCQRGTVGGFDVLVMDERVRKSAAERVGGVGLVAKVVLGVVVAGSVACL